MTPLLMVPVACVVLLAAAALPVWPHSRAWGWLPASGIALVAVLLLVMHVLNMI